MLYSIHRHDEILYGERLQGLRGEWENFKKTEIQQLIRQGLDRQPAKVKGDSEGSAL